MEVNAAFHGPSVATSDLVQALIRLEVHVGPVAGDRVDLSGRGLELERNPFISLISLQHYIFKIVTQIGFSFHE